MPQSPMRSSLTLIAIFAPALCAQPPVRPYPHPGAPPLVVAGRPVEVRVTPVGERTVRLTVLPLDGSGVPAAWPDEPAVVARQWNTPLLELRSAVPACSVQAGGVRVETATEHGVAFRLSGNGGLRQQLLVDAGSGTLQFRLGEKPLFGLGQGGEQFDRRGHVHPMKPGERNLKQDGMTVPVPWLLSAEGWALFVNRPAGEFDLTGNTGVYRPGKDANAAVIDAFVSLAADPVELMRAYAELTGFPTMPPLWALGYQQSHRTVWNRDQVFGIARTLREKKLPTDVLIYLGTGWCPSGWNDWHGSFDVKKDVFPEPTRDIRELQAMNFKVVLHVVGIPERLYGTVSDAPVPVPDLNQVVQYWKVHQPISRMIDGWWPDVGEEADDAARLARIRMYWEGSRLDHPGQRPYALHRTGYAGMQRYGGWLWSGDVNSTWQTLKTHVAVGINTGLSGVPYWGTDIGGFYSTRELTGELFVRWFQFGAFCPLFRSHGRPSQTRLPWGWNMGGYGEPEMTGTPEGTGLPDLSELHNAAVEPICRKYLELRYRLMPYLYTAVRESHDTGLPVMRALLLHYPDDARAVSRADEYLWGRDILVAPVVEKGATSRAVYLPRGAWYDFWSGQRVEGGREIARAVDLETIPLYVRAGTILPLGPVKQYTAEKAGAPVELVVYPGANGLFTLYDDDGTSFAFERGAFARTRCEWNEARREMTMTAVGGTQPVPQQFTVRLAGEVNGRTVDFSGAALRLRL